MSFFYFVIEDGTLEHQAERCDLPSLDAARMHAASLSQILIAEGRGCFARGEAWQMRVTDEGGFTCFSLQFTAAAAQAGGLHSYRGMAADRFDDPVPGDKVTPRLL